MIEGVEQSFRSFMSCLQTARLYDTSHPRFERALDEAYQSLTAVLGQQDELVIGIVGEELACEREIMFELSRMLRTMILYLKARGIERIVFAAALEKEELRALITFLRMAKDEARGTPAEYLSRAGVRHIAVGRLVGVARGDSPQDGNGGEPDAPGLYDSAMESCSSAVMSALNLEDVDYLNLRFTVNNVLEGLLGKYQDFLKVAFLKRFDQGTFIHSMNVSVLSMFLASRLGMGKDDVLDIGIAALFHDIGKLYVSRKIITKAERLSDEEFAKIKGHTVLGAELLLRQVGALGMLPVLVAFEHHMKNDFRTYPRVLYPREAHYASSLISMCDIYDALFQRRSYKANYPPNLVYDIMMRERDRYFRPALADELFRKMGVWPTGAIVQLSDNSVAVVRDVNEDSIHCPRVEVVFPQEQRRMIDLEEAKGWLKVEKALDPLTEGSEYRAYV